MKWARCNTLTESIWIRCSRRSTRRRWRMSAPPPGAGSVNTCAASAMRRACATERLSGTTIDEDANRVVCHNLLMLVVRAMTETDIDAVATVQVRGWQAGYAVIV